MKFSTEAGRAAAGMPGRKSAFVKARQKPRPALRLVERGFCRANDCSKTGLAPGMRHLTTLWLICAIVILILPVIRIQEVKQEQD
jgi:hypothetical protein